MEPAGVESHASGKDQTDVWSEGSDSRPVNVEAGCAEGEDEDKKLYIFPQCAPAPAPAVNPKGRAARPLSLTSAATSEGRAALPAPLTTADVFGGRATPPTVVSINEGSGPAEFEGLGVSSSSNIGRGVSDHIPNKHGPESLVPSKKATETGKAILRPELGGKESARLKWTAEGSAGTVKCRTRVYVCRL